MRVLVAVLAAPLVCVAMEGVAYLLHRYAMHGFLWGLHRDHHHPSGRGWQRNDAFAAFFSLVTIALYASATRPGWGPLYGVASGVLLYGVGYFLFHDVMFHRRIKTSLRPSTRYLRRITRAHAHHHRASDAHSGVSFGFLYAPPRYDADEGAPESLTA